MPKRPEEFIDSIQDESAALKDLDRNNPFDAITAEETALPPLLDSELETTETFPTRDLQVNSLTTEPPKTLSHSRVDYEGNIWRDAEFFFRQGSERAEIQLNEPIKVETNNGAPERIKIPLDELLLGIRKKSQYRVRLILHDPQWLKDPLSNKELILEQLCKLDGIGITKATILYEGFFKT